MTAREQEHRSRVLFNYLMQASINTDPANRPGAKDSAELQARLSHLMNDLRIAERAGRKAPRGSGFDPELIAIFTARIAASAYALARNAGVLSDVDLPSIAERIP